MAKRIPKPFITQIQAEGTTIERKVIKDELVLEARKLVAKMPTDPNQRLMYVRNLTGQVLRKQVDLDVFKEFIKMTNSWVELQSCMPRAKMIFERERS